MGAIQVDSVICGGLAVSAGLQAARSGQALLDGLFRGPKQVPGEPEALSR